MILDLKTEIDNTFEDLFNVFSSIKEDQIDIVPFEGSWTAGQVAEHIFKSISNLPQVLNGETEPTLRPFDEKNEPIRKMFLDYSIKMNSPKFIVPTASHHDKNNLLNSFNSLKKQFTEAAGTLDLSLTCKGFELPGSGRLTRMELLTFIIVHTQRHNHQLENILQVLNSNSIQ